MRRKQLSQTQDKGGTVEEMMRKLANGRVRRVKPSKSEQQQCNDYTNRPCEKPKDK